MSGDKTTYSYDTQNRLLDAKTTNGGTTVSDYSYTYDAASNLTKQVDTANGSTDTYSYTVDPDNAVTSETADGVGFRYTDDGDGNLTGWDGGWNLTYNAQNQTTSIQTGGLSESYTYSGLDQQELLSFTDNGDTTQVANSALGETYQADANGGLRFERDNRGGLVSKSPDGTNYYFYLFDGLGSVVAVTDPNGNVANSYAYDPYGNVVSSSTTVGNPFEYVSSWTSSVTTFTHFGARWDASDPNFTRWTQQDPIEGSLGNPTSQCRYAYAQDDPVNLVDPSGRQSPSGYLQQCLSQAWASFLAIGGGAAGLFSGLGTLLESGAVGFFTATGAYLSIIFGGIAVLYGLYQIQAACAPYAPFPPPGTLV